MKFCYLAQPYSHPDESVREERYQLSNRLAATMILRGWNPYAPITHSHPIAAHLPDDIKSSWALWSAVDFAWLSTCKFAFVMCIPGWEASVGVTAEIGYCWRNNIPIEYITFDGESVGQYKPTPRQISDGRGGMRSVGRLAEFRCPYCGVAFTAIIKAVRSGAKRSCGCIATRRGDLTYPNGKFNHELYQTWYGIRRRCFEKSRQDYRYYGGRGITMCDRWTSFEKFIEDMGPRPTPKHSVERVDNNGHYEPDNCVWATHTEQMLNRSNCVKT